MGVALLEVREGLHCPRGHGRGSAEFSLSGAGVRGFAGGDEDWTALLGRDGPGQRDGPARGERTAGPGVPAGGWKRALLILGSAQPQCGPPAGTKRLLEEFAGSRRCGLAGGLEFCGAPERPITTTTPSHPPAGGRGGARR